MISIERPLGTNSPFINGRMKRFPARIIVNREVRSTLSLCTKLIGPKVQLDEDQMYAFPSVVFVVPWSNVSTHYSAENASSSLTVFHTCFSQDACFSPDACLGLKAEMIDGPEDIPAVQTVPVVVAETRSDGTAVGQTEDFDDPVRFADVIVFEN